MPQLGYGPGGGLGFRHRQAQWPSLLHLMQGPGGFLSLLVDGCLEPCRTVCLRRREGGEGRKVEVVELDLEQLQGDWER